METPGKRDASAILALARSERRDPFDGGVPFGSMLPAPPVTVVCGSLEIDRIARTAALAGADLLLTEREHDVLLYLADHANRVVRGAELLEQLWRVEDDDGSNLIAVYICRLRRKLGVHASMLTTIRGIGYRLRPTLDG